MLVGVTKYDHLPTSLHLVGPANDAHLMRQLLEKSDHFVADAIVSLTEDEGRPDRRPTRANIAREFRRLAEQAREGDQVVILLAGHGARQPADPNNREPDGIDEIFLPADVAKWQVFPKKVPNALADKEMGKWLEAITTKKAYVWIIFDCCHSGTMTRGTEVARELPPNLLVPEAELDKARERAAQRGKSRGGPEAKSAAFVPQEPSDYLVATYACREFETTPESPQPVESATAKSHGLLTYSVVDILTKSAASKAPLTYRELVKRIQVRYAARPQGSPTPLIEGKGQNQVVLGTEQPARPRLLLRRDDDHYKVDAGDLYGLT
ncbi:MAG: caspase family protein, partial [Gemmataceae bacterium]